MFSLCFSFIFFFFFVLFFICFCFFFFFNDTATTEIYTLSLHDALPISGTGSPRSPCPRSGPGSATCLRSEEHTSELQSHVKLVCRLLLEKKNQHSFNTFMPDRIVYIIHFLFILTIY